MNTDERLNIERTNPAGWHGSATPAPPLTVLAPGTPLDPAEKERLGPLGNLYQDRFVTVSRDLVRRSDGHTFGHIRICLTAANDGVGGVVVVPRWRDRILLGRIFRPPTRQWHLELPRGMSHDGLSMEETAKIELLEEFGTAATGVEFLGIIWADTGLIGHSVHVFGAEIPDTAHDFASAMEEGITDVIKVPVSQIRHLVATGEINDGISLAALHLAQSRGFLKGPDRRLVL